MPDTTKGAFKLQDVRDQTLKNCWSYTIAGLDAGLLNSWGAGTLGIQGRNSTDNTSSPAQIPGSWIKFSPGAGHAAGIKPDNTLWIWGANSNGQLGQNNVANTSSPTQVPGTTWCHVFAGNNMTGAVKTDGTLWVWGSASFGALGDISTVPKSSPVQIPGTTWCLYTSDGARQISHALKTDGTLWSWGYDGGQGFSGFGSCSQASSPIQIPGTTWCYAISGGGLKTNGTLWTWGPRNQGDIGDDLQQNNAYVISPIQIPGTTWCKISFGPSARGRWALKTNGTLWSWGYNNQGVLGTSNNIYYSSPVQIPGTTWCFVGAARSLQGASQTTHAVKTDNTLWGWGGYYQGTIGDGVGSGGYRNSPVQVPGTWCCAEAGYQAGFGLRKI